MSRRADPAGAGAASRPANRLAAEASPYLLQHAHNPVDWHPWGDAAFALARATQRPIFLSIGYATCHWCHVMEHESFEDERVAAALNADFVPIKVDREERPDVDRLYMSALQGLGLGGGWPLTVFLTPDLAPFYGGTYFPPTSRGGMPGLIELLARVHEAWTTNRAALESDGAQVLGALSEAARATAADDTAPAEELCARAYAALVHAADPEWGGFGRQPKFPTPANLVFLLRWAERVAPSEPAQAEDARRLAVHQLVRMKEGGIHDHLGGGFHRYSVDRQWLVPHFEKMLYDQAQLAVAYLDAARAAGAPALADAARGIFAYLERDLSAPEGGFHAAEDADSEGREGAFYAWTPAQLAAALGPERAAVFARRYGVTEEGNFEHGASVLHEAEPLASLAAAQGGTRAELERELAEARAVLLAARAQRPRPQKDDKVLTAWNGLAIEAFARGAVALGEPSLAERAARAGEFAWSRLRDPATGDLARYARGGAARGRGQLDDYANLCGGYLELYRATFDPAWLERALALAEAMVARFADADDSGFFDAPADASVRVRLKSDFDGAETAGNSRAARALVRLAAWTDRADLRAHAERTLAAMAARIASHPVAMPLLLAAQLDALAPPRHVVLVGDGAGGGAALREMIAVARAHERAGDALFVIGSDSVRARLAALAPFVAALPAPASTQAGQNAAGATAYVCESYTCRAPVSSAAELAAALGIP